MIVNGTFDTDLSGWILWVPYPYCSNVTWDSGRARIYTCDCIFGPGADMLSLSQEFLIDNMVFMFDWDSNGYDYARPSYELSVWIEGAWKVISSRRFGDYTTDPTSGTEIVDVSQYVGKTARIKFSLKNGGRYACLVYRDKIMWVDNVMVVPNWGIFEISSDPAGAEIWMDGSNTGYLSPKTIPEVAVGSHTVVLKKAGYYDYTTAINVVPGRTYTISPTLQMKVGCLMFYTAPPGAKIFLSEKDGNILSDTGFATPYNICSLPWGTYKWKLYKDWYAEERGTVVLDSAEGVLISRTLVPAGNVHFVTDPQGASIIIDGVLQERVTPTTISGLVEGMHEYILSLERYRSVADKVYVYVNQTVEVTKTLELIVGAVSFTSSPQGAGIFLDGVDQGVSTPATITSVPTGSHTYTLRLAGYNDYSGMVLVEEDKTSQISATLTLAEGCIYFITNPEGARIFIDDVDTGKVTPALVCGLSLGTHTYRLVLAGYQDVTGTANLVSGQGVMVTGSFAPGVGAGALLGLSLLGLGVLGAVILAAREKKAGVP